MDEIAMMRYDSAIKLTIVFLLIHSVSIFCIIGKYRLGMHPEDNDVWFVCASRNVWFVCASRNVWFVCASRNVGWIWYIQLLMIGHNESDQQLSMCHSLRFERCLFTWFVFPDYPSSDIVDFFYNDCWYNDCYDFLLQILWFKKDHCVFFYNSFK